MGHPRMKPRTFKAQVLMTTALVAVVLLVSIAKADPTEAIDVPQQPIMNAVEELSVETGRSITVNPALLGDRQSQMVQGPLTAHQALVAMIDDPTLDVSELSDGSLVVTRGPNLNFVKQDASEPFDLGPIILRGELLSRALEDSPTSAVVISGEALNRSTSPDIYDVIERTPGVSTSLDGDGFSIRGIDQRGASGGDSNGLTISTQVDGVSLPTSTSISSGPFSTWDVEQIEILRGPQSTQQGRNALAGAIIFRPNDPVFFPEYSVRAEAGSDSFGRLSLMANTPFEDDRLALRFSGDFQTDNGFVTNTFLGTDADERESLNLRGALRWRPSDRFDTTLSYSYSETNRGDGRIPGEGFPPTFDISSELDAFIDNTHRNLGLRVDWELSESVRLLSETNVYSFDQTSLLDQDFTSADDVVIRFDAKNEVFEQDLTVEFDYESLRGAVGLFYTDISIQDDRRNDLDLGTLTGNAALSDLILLRREFADTETQNFAVFGEVDIDANRILPGLGFTLGARYDHEEQTVNSFEAFAAPVPLPPTFIDNSFSGTTTYEAFLPKIGVTYDFTPDQSVSFTYQTGYRSGGVSAGFGGSVPFDPEFTDNFELAYRGAFFDDRVIFAVNVFYTEFRDQQVVQFREPAPGINEAVVTNAASSRAFGGEVSLDVEVTERLRVGAGFSYSDTEFLDFVSEGVDFSGNAFPLAPDRTASLTAEYTWGSGISLSGSASYTGTAFSSPANTTTYDDRWLVDAALTYEDNGWLAGTYVRNLLDEEYLVFDRGFAPNAVTVGEPRSIGLFVQRNF